jgi:two-component system phosphate regulon sensor histidine kinase PhoR
VKDNGPGIPEKHHNRLFERFYRIDEARARDVGGTGIGLSLVKHIMLRHGGNVYLNSEEGQGAEFICEFPQ